MSTRNIAKEEIKQLICAKIETHFGVLPSDATEDQVYDATCRVLKDIMTDLYIDSEKKIEADKAKRVYYMSMEYLIGKSLKNNLFNLGLTEVFRDALDEIGYPLESLYEDEPDAGLGNGGLGRLAAAYADALATKRYPVSGFSLRFDYGIFKQELENGWQQEKPDNWLDKGEVWLSLRKEDTFEVHFDGYIEENWTEDGKLSVEHKDYYKVLAVPYDILVTGYHSDVISTIRLWRAKAPSSLDLGLFSEGKYTEAFAETALAQSITSVLYPADDHIEGKNLRLKQQYFFVSASIQNIIKKHLSVYGTLDNLGEKVSVHINDTHPSLCIPELMRVLMDDYGYQWDKAWDIVCQSMSYTNHTVMAEALEKWPADLMKARLPRIYSIITEIHRRFEQVLWQHYGSRQDIIQKNDILFGGEVRMANMCLAACHHINGVSALHTEILKNDQFRDYYAIAADKFVNVTNGITYRRWLCQANPGLSDLISELIGDSFKNNAMDLAKLLAYQNDTSVHERLEEIKYANKVRLADFIARENGIRVDASTLFDVQVKRLHEYKRQLLNAIHILDLYYRLKENPNLDIRPRTFIFGAKAASNYTMAKHIIQLIYHMSVMINNDPSIHDKIKIVFIEDYKVSLAEIIIPAAEISEQISTAGKEASGTSNMKFMINGALTLGTMDGANVEIFEQVGPENIFLFGHTVEEVERIYAEGYKAYDFYQNNPAIRRVIDNLRQGINGVRFEHIAQYLTMGLGYMADPYLMLADFESYKAAQQRVADTYADRSAWNRMSLINIAKAGIFSADRSITEYAEKIWHISPIKEDK